LFASPGLFRDTVCIVTSTKYTDKRALEKIKIFWMRLGARVRTLSPQAHDKVVAGISHLPHLLSYNLCNSISSGDLKVAGSGFKDTTRIAKSDPAMWSDIFIQNRKNILRSIGVFQKFLYQLKDDIIRNRKKELFKKLNAAKQKRDKLG